MAGPARDFRGFLELLRRGGELVEVAEEVSAVHELAARVYADEAGANRAFLFRRVAGHTIPVAAGLYGSTRRHLLGLGLASMEEFADRLDAAIRRPLPPKVVARKEAPAKEVVWPAAHGLTRLPVPVHFRGDGGPYITAGVVTLGDGERQNAGVYRIHVHGDRELTVFINRFKDGNRILRQAAETGRPVEVAISIGVDPAVFVASMWPVAADVEEFGVAGGLMGAPLELVACESVDLEVPAHAEIVLEGKIHPGMTRVEGPFLDITMQTSSAGPQPVIEVTAITSRRDPIFHTVLASDSREHFKSRGNDFWRDYQSTGRLRIAGLAEGLGTSYDIFFPPAACNFHAVASLRKRDDAAPRCLIETLFRTHKYLKRVIVVDDDIDIRDAAQVEWAVATRVGRPEQISLDTGAGSALDTSAEGEVIKLGIDATVPMARRAEVLGPKAAAMPQGSEGGAP